MRKLGILSAMSEEIESLVQVMDTDRVHLRGMRAYHEGELWGVPCVAVFSRWGKVAAATTATDLISTFQVDHVFFTGVAGAVDPGLAIGDIVVGTRLVQHDMDARPLFSRHEIPLLGITAFPVSPAESDPLTAACRSFLDHGFRNSIPEPIRRAFRLAEPKVAQGEIASGDRFFADAQALQDLRQRLPQVLCVEMEGAAVAQVCHEYGIPFSIVRTISDSADENAPLDFPSFARQVATHYSQGILQKWLQMNPKWLQKI